MKTLINLFLTQTMALSGNVSKKLILLVLLISPAIHVFGQSTSWIGGTNDDWSTASNWTAGVPDNATDAVIGDGSYVGPYFPTISRSATCNSLTVGNSSTPITLSINDNLTVSGDLLVGSNGTLVHTKIFWWIFSFNNPLTITGDVTINGSFTSSSEVQFNGVGVQTISGSSAITFEDVYVQFSSKTTLGANITVDNRMTVRNGTFDPSTFTVSGACDIRLEESAVLMVKASTFSGNYANSGGINFGSNNVVVDYASTGINQSITNSFDYRILKISGAFTKTLTGNTNVRNELLVEGGTLNLLTFKANRNTAGGRIYIANNATLKIGGSSTFPANYVNHNLQSSSTVEYYGNNQIVSQETYGNLTLSTSSSGVVKTMPTNEMVIYGHFTSYVNAGNLTFTAGQNIQVLGNVSIGVSTVFNGGGYNLFCSANWVNNGTYNGTSNKWIVFYGTGATLSGSGTNNFGHISFNGNGIVMSQNTSATVSGQLQTSGAGSFLHTTGGSGAITMNGTAWIVGSNIVFDDLIVANTGNIYSDNIFEIAGNLTSNGSFVGNLSTVTMSGTSKVINGSGNTQFANLAVAGSITTGNNINIKTSFSVSGSYSASAGVTTVIDNASFSGIAQLYNLTVNNTKTFTLGSESVLKVSGTDALIGTGNVNVSANIPNTIEYNSSGPQTPALRNFHNLIFSNGNTKTAPDAMEVAADFTIGSATTFEPGNYTHRIGGDWMNNGAFISGTSIIELDGTQDANISGITTFNRLTLNKTLSNVVSLNDNINVSTLAMTAGNMHTGSNSVTITNTRSGDGIILGTITRTHGFNMATNYHFEGPNNFINFLVVGSVSSVTVTVVPSPILAFPSGEAINREYDISVVGSGYISTLRLHYEQNELNGNAEAGLNLWNDAGTGSWTDKDKSFNDEDDNWVELMGVTNLLNKWTCSNGANIYSWNGSNSTSWSDALNWSGGVVPTITDEVQLGDLVCTNQPVITSTQQVKGITFGSVTPVTLTLASGSLTVQGNIDGVWATDATHTIAVGSRTLTIFSDLILSEGTSNRAINLTLSTGTINISGDLVQTGGANITFTSSGSINIGDHYTYVSGALTPSSGTVSYNGTNDQQIANLTYNNLNIDKFSGTAVIATPTTVNGNLQLMTGGQLRLAADLTVLGEVNIGAGTTITGGSATASVGGNWVNNGTFTPGSGTVIFNGTGAQIIGASNFNNFIVNKTSGVATLSGDLTINGDATLSSGNLDALTYNLTRTTLGGAATINAAGSIDFAGSSVQIINFQNVIIDPSSTVTFNGTDTQSIPPVAFGNLIISNGAANAKTMVGPTSVLGNLTVNSGATMVAPATSLSLQGNLLVDGSLDTNGGTILLDGTNKTINGAITYSNLIVNGSYDYQSGNSTIDSLLHITPSGDIDFATISLTSNGDLVNEGVLHSSGIVTFSGTRVQTLRLLNAVSSASTGVINFNGTVSPVFNSNTPPHYATVNINNTGGLIASQPWTVNVGMNIGSGANWDAGAFEHTLRGNFVNNGSVISTGKLNFQSIYFPTSISLGSLITTGEVEFGGTQLVTLVHNNQSFGTVSVSNTHSNGITPNNNWTIANDMQISPLATLHGGAGLTHTVSGSWTNDGTFDGTNSTVIFKSSTGTDLLRGSGATSFNNITFDTGTTLDVLTPFSVLSDFINNADDLDLSTSEVTFKGNGLSLIGGSTVSLFQNLEINKSANGVRLEANVIVANQIDLTGGVLDLNTNILSVTSNLSTAISRTGGYILSEDTGNLGRVNWTIGTDTNPHIFPFGNASANYLPFTFDLSSGDAGIVSVATYATGTDNTPYPASVDDLTDGFGNDMSDNVVDRFFQIDLSGQTSPIADITFTASASEVGGIIDLLAQRWNGSEWDTPLLGQANTAYTVTVPNVSEFSPWVMVGSSFALPINLISFDAKYVDDVAVLNWVTAAEFNNDRFEVYKSDQTMNFKKIGDVKGAGNSSQMLNYSMKDRDMKTGISYYRLKQIDYDGLASYSGVVAITVDGIMKSVKCYPNPSNGQNLKIDLSGFSNQEVLITILDIKGAMLYQQMVQPDWDKTTNNVEFDKLPPKGINIIQITSGNYHHTEKILIQ
jgi:fibronectin-binding autotransporter adhesin